MPRHEAPKRRSARRARDASEGARPAGNAVWSGSISFGLVTVPVELYAAQRPGGVPLRMLSSDGTPLERQYVCPKEDRALAWDEIARGYPVGRDEFVLLSDEELESLAPRRSRDIELSRFVKRERVDPSYFVRAYFLVPRGEQTKAYALLAQTMEAAGRAAIGSFVMRDKAHAVAIFADAGILRAELLRFGDELRSAAEVGLPKPSSSDAARVRKMRKAIDALVKPALDEDELRDEGSERLRALARKKRLRGEDVVEAPERPAAAEGEPAGGELVDLVALLKKRLRASGRAGPKRAGSREKAPAKRKRV